MKQFRSPSIVEREIHVRFKEKVSKSKNSLLQILLELDFKRGYFLFLLGVD